MFKLSIKQNIWGARMHYLRFIFPETAYQYIEAGIKFDSSLFFDDAPDLDAEHVISINCLIH